ncbi:MAG TPA: DNA internalization-related competence protein ComEC/Rec2 [Candidatus Acidoferrales bacterium]|nr:DNA internalization-related competence protein ComEC/Rec2 [Candidatus Acidoferrales bacterium]
MKVPALLVFPLSCIGILAAALHPFPLWGVTGFAALAFVVGALLWSAHADRLALTAAMAGWVGVGALAITVEHRSRSPNLVSDLIGSQQLDASQPMRLRGVLRENTERLPWGARFDVDLEAVEAFGQSVPVSGGLRASCFGESLGELPALRAGNRVELIALARLPRNFQNPGAYDYRAQLARQNIFLTASVRSPALVTKLSEGTPSLQHYLARARGRLLERAEILFGDSPKQAAVLRAMLLGDRGFLDNEVADTFRKTSSYHVLVIAGLHVAALATFVVWICGRLRLRRVTTSIATLAALGAYLAIVQDRPPILRATLMAAAYLLARVFFRKMDILQSASLAAFLIVFIRPSELADPSFQLSFLAVAAMGGIALPWLERTAEPLRHALQHIGDVTRDPAHAPRLIQLRLDLRALSNAFRTKLPSWLKRHSEGIISLPFRAVTLLWETFVISSVIQLGLMPLLADEFHRLAVVGPIANVPAVILTGIIVPLGFLSLAVSFLSMAAGHAIARFTGIAVALLLQTVTWFGGIHFASFRVPSVSTVLLVIFFATLMILAFAVRKRMHWLQWSAGAVVAASVLIVLIHPFSPQFYRGRLEFTVLDVGQGDSLFLAAPDGHTMLIDGGGGPGALRIGGVQTRFDIGEEVVSRFLWSRGLTHLDVIAVTHAHEDHMEGLFAVLQNFKVGELWVGYDDSSPLFRKLLETAHSRGTKIVHLDFGNSFNWGDLHGTVLWPDTKSSLAQATNNNSLVMRVQFGQESLLLTGDIERAAERAVTSEGVPIESRFLKVPHHGSGNSTTEILLEEVHPGIAAISVGENNPFNHPSPATVARLKAAGAKVFRTDRDGAITLISDGSSEEVTTFAQTHAQGSACLYALLLR